MSGRPRLQRGTVQTIRIPQKQKTAEEQAAEQARGLEELGRLPSQVKERLYLGSCYNGRSLESLCECGITHVINVAEEVEDPDEEVRQMVAYERINIREAEGVFRQQVDTYKTITARIRAALEDGANSVLVHCKHGHSRSASVVVAYLMETEGMDLAAATTFVQQCRPEAKPNRMIAKQLLVLQSALAPYASTG